MTHEIKGDHRIRGHSRARSFSLESITITTALNNVYQLEVSSPSNVFLVGSDDNQYLNLGSADTYQIGHRYDFMNDSSKPVIIRDYQMNVLYELGPSAGITIQLENNGSPQGIWFIPQTELRKVLIDLTNIVGIGGANAQEFIENFLSINGLPVINEVPSGNKDCVNLVFGTAFEFIPGTLEVFLSDLKLCPGLDYSEALNAQGFTVIINAQDRNRLNRAPMESEDLLVNYSRRVIF